MNLWACGQLSTSPETQTWYRAIQPQFWTTALQTSQTTTFPTRFNEGANAHPQFEILYLAEDHQLALFEAQALLGSPLTPGSIVPQPRKAWVILNVQGCAASSRRFNAGDFTKHRRYDGAGTHW